jgi:hypothetical protein
VVCAETHDSVREVLRDVEGLTRDLGLDAVGYITYEAGGASGLPVMADGREPLARCGLFYTGSAVNLVIA